MKKFIPALLAVASMPAYFAGAAPILSAQAAACCCGEACKCEDCKCTGTADKPCTCQSGNCCAK